MNMNLMILKDVIFLIQQLEVAEQCADLKEKIIEYITDVCEDLEETIEEEGQR